jgi:hypothetical protein
VQFQQGQSGNPGGRKKERIWRDAIHRAVMRATANKVDYRKLDELADALVEAGMEKNVPALTEIGNRLDGKVPQALIGSDDPDDAPLTIQHIELVAVPPEGGK